MLPYHGLSFFRIVFDSVKKPINDHTVLQIGPAMENDDGAFSYSFVFWSFCSLQMRTSLLSIVRTMKEPKQIIFLFGLNSCSYITSFLLLNMSSELTGKNRNMWPVLSRNVKPASNCPSVWECFNSFFTTMVATAEILLDFALTQ